jgi:hypothetical protein
VVRNILSSVQVHLTVTLIYDLVEEVPPNVPDRHSKSRKTSRKEKPAVQTRSSSMKLKRPPQDSVARKPSSKDQIPRKKQKIESTVVSSSRKDKKPKSKKHKKKKHKSKKKKRGKRKHKVNSNRKRHRSKNTKQGHSAEGKSKDSS